MNEIYEIIEIPRKVNETTYEIQRSKNSSTGLDEPVKSKFTHLEIGKPC
jgi:hypothetical protein